MKGDKMKIAFYDSGMGGLSVLNHAMHILPNEEYLYFADVDNVPYGTKTKDEILLLDSEKYGYLAEKSIFGITGKHIFQNYYFTNKCPLDEFFTTTKGISFLQEYYIPEIFQKMSKSEFEKQNILLTKILKK